MSPAAKRERAAPPASFLDAFNEVSEAVEAGAGLPSVVRAAAHALDASLAVVDRAGSVLAIAAESSEDERIVLALEHATAAVELRVGDEPVGELRMRARSDAPPAALVRMVTTLIALEADRSRAPERESEAAVGDFIADLLGRRLTDRENILARAEELGCDLAGGGSVVVARARPLSPVEGDWRARVLTIGERGARAVERTALAAMVEIGPTRPLTDGGPGRRDRELVIVLPGRDADGARRAADAVHHELEGGLEGFHVAVAVSRPATDPADLHRAGSEALLAANVAGARGESLLSFEETGAYRLLLPAMSEDPAELHRFHEETVAPLVTYDEQYETELVRTLETFLDSDGNIARTAEKLFTHRHTIRYRLDRVKELSGLDVGSTDGRERLSLGLKAMRVLGIVPPGGPAYEAGAEAGRVPAHEKDR